MHYELFCTFAAKKLKLKRILSIILLFCALSIAAQPKYEVRAVWLTTLGGLDWPKSYAHDGMGIQRQQEDLCNMLDQLQAINVNTVLFQTRVRATTAYPWLGPSAVRYRRVSSSRNGAACVGGCHPYRKVEHHWLQDDA